jgi:hypothetical protein
MNVSRVLNNLIRQTRRRCIKTGKRFELTLKGLESLWKKQAGCCAVTGIKFMEPNGQRHPYSPSLDRININDGYYYQNIRLVCLIVNMGNFTWGIKYLDKMVVCRVIRLIQKDEVLCNYIKDQIDKTGVQVQRTLTPEKVSEGGCQGKLRLPEGWFRVRRRLGLSLPIPCETKEYISGKACRWYRMDNVISWLNNNPDAMNFDPVAAIKVITLQKQG